jgi:very-short-patch-repair endonuclease
LHRSSLAADDICVVRGLRVTTPLRTAIDVARCCELERAVAIIDGLIRHRLIRHEELLCAAAHLTGANSAKVKLAATLASAKSGSVLESITRVLLWKHDLLPTHEQYSFRHPKRGWIGYMDFTWPRLKAILECDGYEFHADRVTFQRDRRRWTAVSTAGWCIAIVTWFDVTCDPEYVVAVVRELTAAQPPATAGMIDTEAPSGVGVASPSANRTSSSFT